MIGGTGAEFTADRDRWHVAHCACVQSNRRLWTTTLATMRPAASETATMIMENAVSMAATVSRSRKDWSERKPSEPGTSRTMPGSLGTDEGRCQMRA